MGAVAMWMVAIQITVIYALSNIPTPLYQIYQREFHFSQITLTLVYAAYVIGTVVVMFFLGKLSDQRGRRPVVLISLGIAAAGNVVFICANGIGWLFPARILSGMAIALASGASTAWILELEPRQNKTLATQIAIAANLTGLSAGPLIAGLLAQYAPWPLRLTYILFFALLIPTAAIIAVTRETVREIKPVSFRPRLGVPREVRGRFFAVAISAFAAFSVMGFYSALIPGLLQHELHQENPAVAGAIVAELFFIGAIAVACAGKWKSRTGLITALALLLPSIGLLALSEAMRSLPVLIAGTFISGIATGSAYNFSLRSANELAPPDQRAEIVSTYLIACYCGISLPVIGVGILSKATSPQIADIVFAAVIAIATIIALVVEVKVAFSSHQDEGN